MPSVLCPYCFERFAADDIPFRCTGSDDTLCPPTGDDPLRIYHQQIAARIMKPAFQPKSQGLRGWLGSQLTAQCPTCHHRSRIRLCPRCHNNLPEGYGKRRSRVLALVGAKGAGKSVYIGALLQSLKNGALSHSFGTSLRPLDEHTIRSQRDILDRLMKEELALNATLVGSTRSPMVFELTRQRRYHGVLAPFARWIEWFFPQPSVTLVFFDTAGETLDNIELASVEARYISRSDGLIFLLDPLQMENIRVRLRQEGKDGLPVAHTDPSEITDRVIWLFEEMEQMKRNRVGATVAVTISKIDEIRHLFEPGSPVTYAANHDGYFDQSDAERMHECVQSQLRTQLGNDLPNRLNSKFHHYNFFAISSLGAAPEGTRLTKGMVPFRVEDPLLYILSRWGFIPRKVSRPTAS